MADDNICTGPGYGHVIPQGSDGYGCPNICLAPVLELGGLILFKCTTLGDLLLPFCKRSEGGLIRLISLPEITEPGRGRMGLKVMSAQRLPILLMAS